MKKLLVATRNVGKLKEISNFLSGLPLQIISLNDVGIIDDVEESGKTYEENSRIKALFYAKKSGLPTIADDGGIEISALGGAPGIKSKRWLGKDSTEEDIIKHMAKIAAGLPENNRAAFFKTVISFALPAGKVWSVTGEVEGIIAQKPYLRALKGYPYRSFFYLPKLKKYYHEDQLTSDEEKEYNHRYLAISRLKPIITKALMIKD
ncbi:MAG: non-canonical purine pyrophosphatase, rdgB/HAM1 family [Candidatus Levybacteria bacterium]|nr:non-canonical purine pyrophosphatase, rdgB/HAM1 family [Candidatus Levybacteria bacterium]